jgi:hypothetical protein
VFLRELESLREEEKRKKHKVDFLYRGVGNSAWSLDTTLERAGRREEKLLVYMQLILRIRPQIETFTGQKWDVREFPEVQQFLAQPELRKLSRFPGKEYPYMVHLRHHGFPSPLLDWTRSEYVAAFFAFRVSAKPESGKVSIFVFSETPEGFKSSSEGHPYIERCGPYVVTHRRHFLQQSDYTICVRKATQWQFESHQSVFEEKDTQQDLLWKFNLPWDERTRVLQMLDAYNLNAYSLFDSEESLMETIATRELDFK